MKSSGEEAPTNWSSSRSLPEDIVLSCLARISNAYYPKLSLVSKSFRDLIFSKDLADERFYLETSEDHVFLCLKLPTRYHPYWFSLYKTKNKSHVLVPLPSSCTPFEPILYKTIGSEVSLFDGRKAPSSVLFFTKTLYSRNRRKTPSMKVARMSNVVINNMDDKIYVMGGCDPEESTHWGEVFDIKTQTWEPLPDPGHELRFSTLKKLRRHERKLYVTTTDEKHDYVYDPEQGSWDVTEQLRDSITCMIDDVRYVFRSKKCLWFDSELDVWINVKGLDMLDTYDENNCIAMADYGGGKLIMFWDTPNEGIWCAVIITLERLQGKVSGQIESVEKLKVPDSSILVSCELGCV